MRRIITLFIFAFTFSYSNNIHAQGTAGGDLYYKCMGGNTYQITYVFHRNFNGMTAPNSVTISYKSPSNSALNFTSSVYKTAGPIIISPVCSGSSSSLLGVEDYVYQGNVTLPPASDWKIICSIFCRYPVNTLTGSNYDFYAEAHLNNLNVTGHSSVYFSNPPTINICNNQPVIIDPGIIDPNGMGDSIACSIEAPFGGYGNSLSYISPYSTSNIISTSSGMNFYPQTGIIELTPNLAMMSMYVLKVENYRKINGVYVKLGDAVRDIIIQVSNCQNANPVLSGIDLSTTNNYSYNPDDTTYYIETSFNTPLSFKINGHDSDVYNPSNSGSPEKFILSWNNPIQGATFNIYNNNSDTAWARFSWTPLIDDNGKTFNFSVKIQDKGCAYNNINYSNYSIKVICDSIITYDWIQDTILCVNNSITLNAPTNLSNYQWSTGDTTNAILLVGSQLNDSNQMYLTANYGGCIYTDSFFVEVSPCTGIENINSENNIEIYPNPSDGIFNLSLNNYLGECQILVSDNMGKLLYFNKYNVESKYKPNLELDLSSLKTGVYFIKIISEINGIIVKQVVINN